MPQTADYTYEQYADCFVVTDRNGDELCRTKSPHTNGDKTLVSYIVSAINDGHLIFPTKEAQP